MVLALQDNGAKELMLDKVEALRSGRTVHCMKVTGKIIKLTESED